MRERAKAWWKLLPHPVRWVLVAIVGASCILLGLAGVVLPLLPGPALIVLGLVILASEFAWAQVVLDRVRHHGSGVANWVKTRLKRG
jgi:uncharacterized membrane protein YbaN (DUF454 family)